MGELPTELTIPYKSVVTVLASDLDDAPGWWLVRHPHSTAIGLVPADYLHVVSPGEDPAAFLDLDPEYEAIEDSRVQARRDAYGSLTKGDCLRVTTAFNPEFDTELSVLAGDIIKVMGTQPPEWVYAKRISSAFPSWRGPDTRAKKGLIPFGYCGPDPVPRPSSDARSLDPETVEGPPPILLSQGWSRSPIRSPIRSRSRSPIRSRRSSFLVM